MANLVKMFDGFSEFGEVRIGTHFGRFCEYGFGNDENLFIFEYEIGDENFQELYPCTCDGVENALWEWLCTLSRFTTFDRSRTLGSKALFDAA